MNKKHRRTLQAVFDDPVRSNIAWRDVEAMLEAASAEITAGEGSRVRIALNGVRAPVPWYVGLHEKNQKNHSGASAARMG